MFKSIICLFFFLAAIFAANPSAPSLGTAASYAVLAGQGVTSSGATTINGDLGTYPLSSITGTPTVSGVTHAGDPTAQQAIADLVIAYNNCTGRSTDSTVATELGGTTVFPGVINTAFGTLQITSTLILDGQNIANPIFIFKASTTLNTALGAKVSLINGAHPRGIFWQVGSSATIGANNTLEGSILAHTSISLGAGTVGKKP